jgi:undecaprenyl-diphosphatase
VDAFQAIVLGIVQGLTEFLPISSTAHLRIIPSFLGWEDPGAAFTAVVQLGTMAAVVLHFWSDLWRIARAWLRSLTDRSAREDFDARMGWYIGLGTIPIAIVGFAFRDQIEDEARNLTLIGIALILGGLFLLMAERVSKRNRPLENLKAGDAAVIGGAQALALIPGVSRSGATIGAGLFVNFDRVSAARYSFLLSVPAVVLSGLFELPEIGDPGGASFWPTLIATISAFVAGYWSISFLLKYLSHASLGIFIIYRFVLGGLVLILVATNAIN